MKVHQGSEEAEPESEFELGELAHLVIGNRGRLRDDRRTSTVAAVLFRQRVPVSRAASAGRAGFAAHLHTPYGLDNQENGAPISICAHPRRPWALMWPQLRHDD